ncbi:MAG: sulfur carrier protein ThiS adenylyltransferase ThiF, partial [Candidatus Aminicenantes bacterium]|nr:sulfur carrier protein ThiS adenylyltransferase ThiF [Candidatus Aminicenantes bacterium]
MNVIAIVGRSGTGKTTLLRNLILEFRRRRRTVAVIKHCGAGFDLGGEDKDSTLFLKAGAEAVTLTGPNGTAVVRIPHRRPKDRDLAAAQAGADYVFIEGAEAGPGIPGIEVVGPNIKNRVPIHERDRWIIVSPRPVRTPKPVFSPGQIGEIADLIEARGGKEPEGRVKRLQAEFYSHHDPVVASVLKTSVVGIAGAGGLGSNVALALARAGVGKLIIADFDRIEISNLNRQQYFGDQLQRVKVEALAENLRRIPSGTNIVARRVRITARNVARVFGGADVLVEAFDRADRKQMLIESWMKHFPDRPIIAASGLAGYGANNRIKERRVGRLTIIGDEAGESPPEVSPMAPRVGIVAAMQANRAVECLMEKRRKSC